MPRSKSQAHAFKFSWRTFLVGIGLLTLLFAINYRFFRAFERMDLIAYDLRINAIAPHPTSGLVAIAAIDDKSIAEIGQWPWPRAVEARLVEALRDYNVKVIGFDTILAEQDENDVTRAAIAKRLGTLNINPKAIAEMVGASNDQAFAAAMKKQGQTILGYEFLSHDFRKLETAKKTVGFSSTVLPPEPAEYGIVRKSAGGQHDLIHADEYQPPLTILGEAARSSGYFDVDADPDGENRTLMTVIKFDDHYCLPLSLAVANAYAGGSAMMLGLDSEGVSAVSIAGIRVPVDEGGRMLVNFRRGPAPFAYYSISDIIHHQVPMEKLAGKIVLVGATAHGLGDRGVTPVNAYMPRVEIHANAIDNIVQGDFIQRTEQGREIAFYAAVILGLLMSAGVAGLSATASAALGVVLAVGYYTYAQARLIDDGLVIPIVFPMLVALATYMGLAGFRYINVGLEKRHLRHAFEHYLHPDVISAVIESRDGLKLGGERRHMTILFADIVNYTGLSEKTDPAALVAMLNNYMTKMTDHIMENDGVVDKIRGDGIMAFWGAPLDVPNHAHLAIESGIAMLAELSVMQKSDARFAELDIGVGIATGDCIVGNFGGERRFDYSVIGDIVNLASRLEGLTRQFKVHMLVSLDTYTEAGAGFIGRELGKVKVKGKELFVPVVHVAGRANDGVDPAFYDRFALALKMIRGGSARTAVSELEHLHEERPTDTPVNMYLERLAADPDHPPSEMVFEFDTK